MYDTVYIFILILWCHFKCFTNTKGDVLLEKLFGYSNFIHNLIILYWFLFGFFFRIREPEAAKRYLKIAYGHDENFLATQKHMLIVNLMQIPRWHFKMLNDNVRNAAYKKAINRALKRNIDSIIDIGSGCGLLSLFASKGGKTKTIHAIESSKAMCKIAKNIFEANKASVNLINCNSTKLNDGKVKGNLIVTEIFDAALFGEHMLDTLTHALDNLVEKDFQIIPRAATVYITGIQSNKLLKLHQVCSDFPEILLKGRSAFVNEPYVVEDLTSFNDIQYLTQTEAIMKVNFEDNDTLKRYVKQNGFQSSAMIKCIRNGTIDALAVWFDLHLDDTVNLTTNPFDENRAKCWEQAIFYLDPPRDVTQNEEIIICGAVVDNKLQFCIFGSPFPDKSRFPVSQDLVSFLNDQYLVNQIKELSSRFSARPSFHVMDFHPFPLFGFLMAKQGATLYCQAKCGNDKAFIEHLAHINRLQRVQIITSDQAFHVLEMLEDLDIMYLPPVSPDGSADESSVGLLPIYGAKLKENGVSLIDSVYLQFEIIECDSLEQSNRVNDANLCGFKVAEYFKEYEATEYAFINYQNLQYKKLSDTKCAGDIVERCVDDTSTRIQVPIIRNGMANAILYWYEFIHFDDSVIDTRKSSHYRCAVFLLPKPRLLTAGTMVNVMWKQMDSCFSLYICD